MAEVVGLVASSIELGRTVAGLVKFCGLVKSAPQQLIAIKEDALLLEIVLKSLMKLSEDGVDLTATEEWDICHRHCMVLTSDLQQLLSDLERKVVDRRVFGSIESVLKRHRVQELQERLRDAKANLGLIMSSRNLTNACAVQVYKQQAMFNSLLAAQSSHLEILVAGQQRLIDSNSSLQCTFPSTQLPHPSVSCEPSDTIPHMSKIARKPDKSTQSYQYQKRLRFFNWAAQISITHAFGQWNYYFGTYSVAHINSDVFKYTRTGNISKLQELFSSKAVSPFVRSYGEAGENDFTLLHHAITYLQVPTAQFLMSQQLDVNALWISVPFFEPMSSLHCLKRACWRYWDYECRTPVLEMARTIFGDPNCSILIGESTHKRLHEWFELTQYPYGLNDRRGLEIDDIILRNIFPPAKQLPFSMRLKRTFIAMSNSVPDEFDISSIWDHLGQQSFDKECIDTIVNSGYEYDALFPVWDALGRAKSGALKAPAPKQVAVWREILRQFIDNGASRLIMKRYNVYLDEFRRSNPELSVSRVAGWLEDMVSSWFLELRLAKMDDDDIAELSQRFAQYCRGNLVKFEADVILRGQFIKGMNRLRVTGFQYGPSPTKARIWSSPDLDEVAADFWHNVETDPPVSYEDATCHVPGQWPLEELQRAPADPWKEERILESVVLYYSQSKRRRRRGARYFGIPPKNVDAEFGISTGEFSSDPIFPPHISLRVKRAVRERLKRVKAKRRSRPRVNVRWEVSFNDWVEEEEQEAGSWCSWTIFRVWGRGELRLDDDPENVDSEDDDSEDDDSEYE